MTIPETEPIELAQEDKWTVIQVDSQILSMFMSCPQKYDYIMNRNLIPIGGISKSIRRGTIVHDAALEYWKVLIEESTNYEKAIRAALTKAKDSLSKQEDLDPDYKLDTLNGILEYLKYIQAQSWIPLAAEKHFRIKAYEDPNLKLRIYLTGRIDLILKSPQIPVLPVDAKTESERWFHSQMRNQFRIYCIATGSNILGVQRIGFQKTVEPKDKFKMEMLPFDQDVLDEWRETTLVHWVKQLLMAHETGYFPMNPTSCIQGHFKCQFSDGMDHKGICNVSRQVREQKLSRYFVKGESWDPENL